MNKEQKGQEMKLIPFDQHKVYLSSPTMHGQEIEFVKEAYESNWMSTIGSNIDEAERLVCDKGMRKKYAGGFCSRNAAALHMAIKLAGMDVYGQPEVGHGALGEKSVADMTFGATVNPVVYEGGEVQYLLIQKVIPGIWILLR